MHPSKIAEPAGPARAKSRGARLARLAIEDFGLIARADLEFATGLTACTGETGSGKTMLLGALAFVLGERASSEDVRTGMPRARATLEVEPDATLRATFEDDGFDLDPGEPAIFVREVQTSGKSSARINGRPATAAQLRAYGALLLEAIGQHEHQRLLSRGYQTDLLDAFAGAEALALRASIVHEYGRSNALAGTLQEISAGSQRAEAEFDDARFAVDEIDAVAPVLGEDDALHERRDYLSNGERIAAALGGAHTALVDAEPGAIEALGSAAVVLASVARFSSSLESLSATLLALQSDANEAAAALARERERVDFDASELDGTTARLDAIERLKKKHGGSIATILQARARFGTTIELGSDRGEREREARAALTQSRERLEHDAAELSKLRTRAACVLEKRLDAELGALAMPAARFSVVLAPLGEPGPGGAESIEFALSPNPGEPVRSLARAASGGELSRLLLALTVVLAGERAESALVFDEIDAGIGGATAVAVGMRLGMLAQTSQVLCVTHLAQIAAWADRHYVLRKRVQNGVTFIDVVALEERSAVLAEIARMLSGCTNAAALHHAETLVRGITR